MRLGRHSRRIFLGRLDFACCQQLDIDRFQADGNVLDMAVDPLAIGKIAVTFSRRNLLEVMPDPSTTIASTWTAGTRATPPASSLRR
jgi:hypothetical protein